MEGVTALEAVVRSAKICRQTFIFSITCEMLSAPGCLLLFIFKQFYYSIMLINVTVSILTHMFMNVSSMLWEVVNPSSMIVYTCTKRHLFKLPMTP